jgi:cytidylate kinase
MVSIVTVDREYGSGGAAIAAQLAQQRGWKLWDQGLATEIARRARCHQSAVERREERNDSLYYRMLKSFFRGGYEGNMNAQHFLEVLDADSLADLTKTVVKEVAKEENCVIVGRGSACILHDHPNAFHVFVYSTPSDKRRRLERGGKNREEAARLIETVDRERSAFIKRYYGKCWPDRCLFNLMVNSSFGEGTALATINNAIAARDAEIAEHLTPMPGVAAAAPVTQSASI